MNEMKQTKKALLAFAILLIAASVFVSAGAADMMSYTDDTNLESDVTYDLRGGTIWGSEPVLSKSITFNGNDHTIHINPDTIPSDKRGLSLLGGLQLNGNTLTIKNVNVDCSSPIEGGGDSTGTFIGWVRDSVGTGKVIFENVHVNGVTLTQTSGNNLGVLVGNAGVPVVCKNCISENCNLNSNAWLVGGLVGTCGSCDFENCVVKGCTLKSGGNFAGGLTGRAGSAASIHISGCQVVDSMISGNNHEVGGLIGCAHQSISNFKLENCLVKNCIVQGGEMNVGGCVGFVNELVESPYEINACKVENTVVVVTNAGTFIVGGIIGGCTAGSSVIMAGNTVDHCTVASKGSGIVGGVAGEIASGFTLSDNSVLNSCVVSKTGSAAGICPSLKTA